SVLTPQLDPISLAQCERDPAGFGRELGHELDLDAFDGDTLQPAATDAQPLDPVLLARLQAGEVAPTRLYFLSPWGGAGLRRAADHGPCGLIQMRWQFSQPDRLYF